MALALGHRQELAPFFDGPVAGHDGGAVFVAAHDDFQRIFAAVWAEDFEAHVVDDDQIGLEVLVSRRRCLLEGLEGQSRTRSKMER